MNKFHGIKKIAAFLICSVLSINLMAAYAEKHPEEKSVSAKTIAEIQEERKQNASEIEALEQKISSIENDKNKQKEYQEALSAQVELIQDNILLLDAEIAGISAEITTAQVNIDNLNSSIADQQLEVDNNIELFKERLCAMYITGNDSLALAVIGSTDFYDMLSRVEMVNSIAAHDEELVNKLLDEITTLEKSKDDLETEMLTLEMKMDEQEAKKSEKESEIALLNEAYQKSEDEIQRLALEEEKMNQSKEELEALNASLELQEQEIVEQIRKQQEEAERIAEQKRQEALKQQQQQQQSGGNVNVVVPDTSPSASGFSWPTPGFYYISSYYGARWGTLHKGIDIAGGGIAGSPVVASKAGTVITVVTSCSHNYPKSGRCCGNGYGNYVTIAHDGTYSTVYGHLNSVNVSVGDYVSQGQVIGTVGTTGFSTGYHLHFEVRKNGVAQNPNNYV